MTFRGPPPPLDLDSDSDEHVATELNLSAIGWMLHHEIAHVVLGHAFIGTAFAHQEELEADHYATNWLLEGQHPDAHRV
jgi:hypothetical protein